MREFLVFFRAGAKSLHGEALAGDPNRNWDCCVSWYSKPAPTGNLAVCSGVWWRFRDSNPGPADYDSVALTD